MLCLGATRLPSGRPAVAAGPCRGGRCFTPDAAADRVWRSIAHHGRGQVPPARGPKGSRLVAVDKEAGNDPLPPPSVTPQRATSPDRAILPSTQHPCRVPPMRWPRGYRLVPRLRDPWSCIGRLAAASRRTGRRPRLSNPWRPGEPVLSPGLSMPPHRHPFTVWGPHRGRDRPRVTGDIGGGVMYFASIHWRCGALGGFMHR